MRFVGVVVCKVVSVAVAVVFVIVIVTSPGTATLNRNLQYISDDGKSLSRSRQGHKFAMSRRRRARRVGGWAAGARGYRRCSAGVAGNGRSRMPLQTSQPLTRDVAVMLIGRSCQ